MGLSKKFQTSLQQTLQKLRENELSVDSDESWEVFRLEFASALETLSKRARKQKEGRQLSELLVDASGFFAQDSISWQEGSPVSRKLLDALLVDLSQESLSELKGVLSQKPGQAATDSQSEEMTLEQVLKQSFLAEASENIETLRGSLPFFSGGAPLTDRVGPRKEAVRAAHSMRGSAHAVELESVEMLAGTLEDSLRAVQEPTLILAKSSQEIFELTIDSLEKAVEAFKAGGLGLRSREVTKLVDRLTDWEFEFQDGPSETPQSRDEVQDDLEIELELELEDSLSEIEPVKTHEPEPPRGETVPAVGESENDLSALFFKESRHHLAQIDERLEELGSIEQPSEALIRLTAMFRSLHGLTGAAEASQFEEIEAVSRALEEKVRASTRKGSLGFEKPALKVVRESISALKRSLTNLEKGKRGMSPKVASKWVAKVQELEVRTAQGVEVEASVELDLSEDVRKLRETFAEESEQLLPSVTDSLLILERNGMEVPEGAAALDTMFRHIHSLKGAARSVGLLSVEQVCQPFESLLANLKRGQLEMSQGVIDTGFAAVDLIRLDVSGLEYPEENRSAVVVALESLANGEVSETDIGKLKPEATPEQVLAATKREEREAESVRLPVGKLDSLLLQAEEMLAVKLVASQQVREIRSVSDGLQAWGRHWSLVRESLPELDDPRHQGLVNFLQWNERFLRDITGQVEVLTRQTLSQQRSTSYRVDNLLEDAKQLLMFPFANLFGRFPRLVRDLSRELGKKVDLRLEGQEIEVDRRILDDLRDPLIHLIRNALDHGVEAPEERRAKGKDERALLTISVAQNQGDRVVVSIEDDGNGLDLENIRRRAVARGLVTGVDAEQLSKKQLTDFIFEPEFSTAKEVTTVSGRGLGMSIVRDQIKLLGGELTVETRAGRGTAFRLTLPVQRATYNGVLVEAGEQKFVLPTMSVLSVHRLNLDTDVNKVGGQPTFTFQDEVIRLFRLEDALGIKRSEKETVSRYFEALLIDAEGQRFAFVVDRVLAEQEVLAKRLGRPLHRVPYLMAGTVLGNGEVVPVLNVVELGRPLVAGGERKLTEDIAPTRPKAESHRVLLVDDSLTSRTLLNAIVESAGYQTESLTHGKEAYERLMAGPRDFDILITDLEMPHMDGLELIRALRAEPEFVDFPIVMVTTLGTAEDRARGAEAGATAYVVKGTLDQTDLLETIKFLL